MFVDLLMFFFEELTLFYLLFVLHFVISFAFISARVLIISFLSTGFRFGLLLFFQDPKGNHLLLSDLLMVALRDIKFHLRIRSSFAESSFSLKSWRFSLFSS